MAALPPHLGTWASSGLLCAEPWIRWDWIERNPDKLWAALGEHLILTGESVVLGVLLAVPLGILAARRGRWHGPILAATGLLYTIPSLALFALLIPYTGLSRWTAVIPLTLYTLLILVRNIVAGLTSVPPEVLDAADGLGFGPWRRLLQVEFPLALPTIVAGVRIATVTTVGMVTVAAIVGQGGLGALIRRGINEDFRTLLVLGSGLSVVVAVAADLALAGALRLAMPWRSGRGPLLQRSRGRGRGGTELS